MLGAYPRKVHNDPPLLSQIQPGNRISLKKIESQSYYFNITKRREEGHENFILLTELDHNEFSVVLSSDQQVKNRNF